MGGLCQGIRNLGSALKEKNIPMEVVCLDAPSASYLGTDDFPIHAIGPANNSWGYSRNLYPWLINNIPRFDTVIVNGIWLYHSIATIKAVQTLRKNRLSDTVDLIKNLRVYIMPHGMLDPYFQKAPGRKLKAIRNVFYWMFLEKKSINAADGIIFTCEEELKLARTTFRHYHPKKEINIGYGIEDVPQFTEQMRTSFSLRCPGLPDTAYYLFLSRIHPKKGVDLLVDAYIDIFKKKKNDEIIPPLVIAGPGIETPYGQSLLSTIAAIPEIASLIFFPGMLKGDAKWGALYGCEVFILPSHQENFGIAIVEALACQKPVLISKEINIFREIYDSGAGIIKDDNLQGTIELLASWRNLPNHEKQAMQLNARHCFENKFTIEKAGDRFIEELKPA